MSATKLIDDFPVVTAHIIKPVFSQSLCCRLLLHCILLLSQLVCDTLKIWFLAVFKVQGSVHAKLEIFVSFNYPRVAPQKAGFYYLAQNWY